MKKKHPIKALIEQGEGLQLDFKFEISDAAKIARSLVAFANTKGGKLLVGVKDNGAIAGVRSEEEIYMIQNAAQRFCKPEILFSTREWNLEGKKVLEVEIPVSRKSPHKAPDHQGLYKAYIRHEDQNQLANGVMMKLWKKDNSDESITITYDDTIQEIMQHLNNNELTDIKTIQYISGLSKHQTEDIVSDLIIMELVELFFKEDKAYYRLKDHK